MSSPEPTILHIDHVGVVVNNMQRSVEFYRDKLGMPEVDRFTTGNGSELVFLKMGAEGLVELICNPNNPPGAHQPAGARDGHICLHVNSLDSWLVKLAALNIPLTSGPSQLQFPTGKVRLCFFADPDGVPVELYEREHDL